MYTTFHMQFGVGWLNMFYAGGCMALAYSILFDLVNSQLCREACFTCMTEKDFIEIVTV